MEGHTKKKLWTCFESWKIIAAHFSNSISYPTTHTWNKTRAKPPCDPSTPVTLAHSTVPFSKCFQSYGYMKKYTDSGSTAPHGLQSLVFVVNIRTDASISSYIYIYIYIKSHVAKVLSNFLRRVHLSNIWSELKCVGIPLHQQLRLKSICNAFKPLSDSMDL